MTNTRITEQGYRRHTSSGHNEDGHWVATFRFRPLKVQVKNFFSLKIYNLISSSATKVSRIAKLSTLVKIKKKVFM